jgi:hypothetical protein
MPGGELQTPLLSRLLVKPCQQNLDAVVEQAHRRRVEAWEVVKKQADNEGGPPPGPRPRLPLDPGDPRQVCQPLGLYQAG